MSKSASKKSVGKSKVAEGFDSSPRQDENMLKSRHSAIGEQLAKPSLGSPDESDKSGLKREYEEDDEALECGSEMNNMLKMFGSDMSKAIHAKKKRVESFTIGTMKANQKMVVEPWQNQLDNSVEIAKEMFNLATSILDQTDNDITQMKEQDEKMIKIFQQQMKTNAQNRNTMLQRVAACRQVNETYLKKAQEQDVKHREELTHMQYDLKKELSTLQKKMLVDGQKEEMDNVKKNLTKMYFMTN